MRSVEQERVLAQAEVLVLAAVRVLPCHQPYGQTQHPKHGWR
jgi:hypothetical protein